MPTACSPRNYASCTSMIGGRLRSVQIPAEGSDSHPFATCVCPIPVSVFHFPFFSLYGPTSFHQKSCHISPFSPAPPSVSRHTFLHFSSPLHRPFVLLHRCLSYPPCTLSFCMPISIQATMETHIKTIGTGRNTYRKNRSL